MNTDQSSKGQGRSAKSDATCAKCGMPITRHYAGWMHKLPPMPTAERRKYRHVITPREGGSMQGFGNNTDGWTIPLDETRAIRFVATGEPIYCQPVEVGARVRVLPGGFTGTLIGYARDGDAIVWHDTHFGSPVLHTFAHLIERA